MVINGLDPCTPGKCEVKVADYSVKISLYNASIYNILSTTNESVTLPNYNCGITELTLFEQGLGAWLNNNGYILQDIVTRMVTAGNCFEPKQIDGLSMT